VGVEGNSAGRRTCLAPPALGRDLTDNVNRLAANLTTQLRAIADVATAVTKAISPFNSGGRTRRGRIRQDNINE